MPSFRHIKDTPEYHAREKLIEEVLPKQPLISDKINDGSFVITRVELTEALVKEIEVYKAFPKKGRYEVEKFNPRNSRECFMGQAFKGNGDGLEGWTDYDLKRYREAVGKIVHNTWGNVTLLEIWGGDHFEKYTEMVVNVFKYAHGHLDKRPKVKFWINPLYANKQSGTWDPHQDEIDQANYRSHMTKIAHYLEIKDRMKAAKVKSPMELGVTEEEDPGDKPPGEKKPKGGR